MNDGFLVEAIDGSHDSILEFLFGCDARPRSSNHGCPLIQKPSEKATVVLGAPQMRPFLAKSQRTRSYESAWWARQDSNLQPDRYERQDIDHLH